MIVQIIILLLVDRRHLDFFLYNFIQILYNYSQDEISIDRSSIDLLSNKLEENFAMYRFLSTQQVVSKEGT